MRYLDTGTATKISKIGVGTWQFGSPEWSYGERYAGQEAHAIVRRAIELGVTLFDTAEIYGFEARPAAVRSLVRGIAVTDPAAAPGFGRGEQILGQALGADRAAAFVATKFYPTVPVGTAVTARARASADRLGTGRIDLYQVHQPGRLARQAAVMRGVRALQQAGTVGEVGVSNASLRRWHAAERALGDRVLANQVEYNLVTRAAEQDLLPFAASAGRIVIAYSPLAQGFLSGRYDPAHRPANPARAGGRLFRPENLDRADPLFGVLREVAAVHAATPAQIALAWVIHHPVVAAIPGASSLRQLENNVAAADIELSDGEYQALRQASDAFRPAPEPQSRPGRVRARIMAWLAELPGRRAERAGQTRDDNVRKTPRRVSATARGGSYGRRGTPTRRSCPQGLRAGE
jgi:aryl-alcohol dehydrogenase-like predicted oxidoreductase